MHREANYDATLLKALETSERAIQLDNNDEYAHWNLGNVLVSLHKHDRGIAEFERATEINPNYSTAWGSLGTALCYAGRSSKGITNNEIALRSAQSQYLLPLFGTCARALPHWRL
jgi:tetratricopeptide (TPR) repeat protein